LHFKPGVHLTQGHPLRYHSYAISYFSSDKMPAPNINSTFFSSLLIALTVIVSSPLAHSEDKAPWVGEALNGDKCTPTIQGFGPHDYLKRALLPDELQVVENRHFTPEIERLESGLSSSAINDIAYTVMAWPNHHRALHSAMRYRMMLWDWPDDSRAPPAECQLQRAIEFSPEDPVPYMMYATLLHKAKQHENALLYYRAALRLRPGDVLTQYNMGLTLVELQQYEEAVKMAQAAYAAGMPLPGLKNKLIAAGKWGDTPNTTASEKEEPEVEVTSAKTPAADTPDKTATADAQKAAP